LVDFQNRTWFYAIGERTSKIGQIVFENEILGFYEDPVYTRSWSLTDKPGATYPTSSSTGAGNRGLESFTFYSSSTTSSTTSGDWVSIGSDKKTLRIGSANGQKGDYIRVFTKAATPPTIDAIADVTINENTAYTSVTPALTGTPIGGVTYTISGNDAADFVIDSSTGVITMVARDYESPVDSDTNNTYALTITVTDEDGNTDSESWVVTVAVPAFKGPEIH